MSQDMVPANEAREQVALACRRLGLLHLAFAEVLVEQLGPEEGKRMAARAIKEYGRLIGEKKREKALKKGMDLGPEDFRALSDLPAFGMHDRIEEVEVDGEKRIRAHGCVMGTVWNDLGKAELGRCYCLVDPASSMAFNPDYKLVQITSLPAGDPYCELVMRPSSELDRAEFAEDDTDWGIIQGASDRGGPRESVRGQLLNRSHDEISMWLRTHGRSSSPVVGRESGPRPTQGFGSVTPLDLSEIPFHVFDLSPESDEFPNGPNTEDAEGWTRLLFGIMKDQGAEVGVGRYDEIRQWYTSDIFLDPERDPPEWRTVHLGIDLFLHPGSPVLAPFDAIVRSVANNAGSLDYGPTVILEHKAESAGAGSFHQFWTLYGHLAQEEVSQLVPGQSLLRGAPFARLGNFPINGNWAPHLHFQIITDLLNHEGNFPGVGLPSQRGKWKALSPNPNLILGIEGLDP
jgi:murein DD-endopeptidase MepM/ murein hydrolase activator NlpD